MVDQSEAPNGYVAVKDPTDGFGCQKCALYQTKLCTDGLCTSSGRKDGCEVIFQKAGLGIDQDEAPEGYIAVAVPFQNVAENCINCDIHGSPFCSTASGHCAPPFRKDHCDVIFKKKESVMTEPKESLVKTIDVRTQRSFTINVDEEQILELVKDSLPPEIKAYDLKLELIGSATPGNSHVKVTFNKVTYNKMAYGKAVV